MRFSTTIAAASLASSASAAGNYLGFNSGAQKTDNSAKFKADWLAEFQTAQNLSGAPGTFNAVRLYTNIQAYSTSDPIEAFEAAIETKTLILLGIWTSGTDSIQNELTALQSAVTKYGKEFTDLVIGISIGSEDLYRDSATGRANKGGVGNGPDQIVKFIGDYRKAFATGAMASVPVGHVDTWDVWPNSTNKAVIDAVDWVGLDEYPYYENGKGNSIENAGQLFDTAYNAAKAAVGSKPLWVTETGWPTAGPDWDLAVPSVDNAKTYWDEIGCRMLFNKVPTFWYNLRDSNGDNKQTFAITNNLSTTPKFNLTCPTTFKTGSSSSSAVASASGSATAILSGSASATGSSSASPTSSSTAGSGSTGSGSAGSGSGSGTSGSGSTSTTTGSGSSTTTAIQAGAGNSIQVITATSFAGLALIAGAFALL